jgi:tetratricopeptide (TPR) repeat protein
MKRIKALWAWALSMLVAGLVAAWAAVSWFTGAAATSTVVGAAGVAALTAGMALSFGDKSNLTHLGDVARQAVVMTTSGQPQQAREYLKSVESLVENHLLEMNSIEPPDGSTDTQESHLRSDRVIMAQGMQQAIAALKSTTDLSAGKITESAWARTCQDILLADPAASSYAMDLFLQAMGDELTLDRAITLSAAQLPEPAQARLASWMVRRVAAQQSGADSIPARMARYQQLLAPLSTSTASRMVLTQFVRGAVAMDRGEAADRALQSIAILRADDEIGVSAARLRLQRISNLDLRRDLALQMLNDVPQSMVARELAPDGVAALFGQARLIDAVTMLERQSSQAAQSLPTAILQNVHLFAARSTLPEPAYFGSKKQATDESVVLTSLLEAMLDTGRSADAVKVAMSSHNVAVIDLVDDGPLLDIEELGDLTDPQQAKVIGLYLLALHRIADGDEQYGAAVLHGLAKTAAVPDSLRAYVLTALAELATAKAEHHQAAGYLTEALAIRPHYRVVDVMLADAVEAQQLAEKRARLESQLRPHQQAMENASAGEHLLAMAELYQQSEFTEQAVGLLLDAVQHDREHEMAPKLLGKAIAILTESGTDERAARAYNLRKRMLTDYPQSSEAEALR